jgi:phosphatidylinositol dimannoside acyltransferase
VNGVAATELRPSPVSSANGATDGSAGAGALSSAPLSPSPKVRAAVAVSGAAEAAAAAGGAASSSSPVRAAAAEFWLDLLFRTAGRAPAITRLTRPLFVRCAYRFSHAIQNATTANARRILGPDVSRERIERFGRGVVENFYDFVCDVGQSLHLTRQQLLARIDSVEGHDHYEAARSLKKGAIIATAHMGSFEAGAAAIVDRERAVHVVFKRDDTRFEHVRTSLRGKLGVSEAPVDEGWPLWLRLREALMRDEVVMVQADRVMPGQKGARVPFLHGHLLLPTGPIKLAIASGAPIIPVFAVRTPQHKIRIHVEPAVIVTDNADASLLELARVLEKYVSAYPEQWLLFHRGFCEDQQPYETNHV